MLKDLVIKSRSYRRVYENFEVSRDTLLQLVELARLSPSGANRQALKFFLSAGDKNEAIFECLGWAGYLTDWAGPGPGERPAAYIVILNDNSIYKGGDVNAGIAAQSMLLGAAELGLGGCMFGSVNRKKLTEYLKLTDNLEILLVIALGKPKEEVVLETVKDGDIKYWRDTNQVHHVPKRTLEEIIL